MSQSLANHLTHTLYEDGDKDLPSQITDSNGDVVLGLCKVCGAGECELDERPCTAPKARIEAQPISTPTPRRARKPGLLPKTQVAAENRAAVIKDLAEFVESHTGIRPAANSTIEQLIVQVSALGGRVRCYAFVGGFNDQAN